MFYLDTNVLLYVTDHHNPKLQQQCQKFILQTRKNQQQLYTSIITIQEIIHFCRRQSQLDRAYKLIAYLKTLNIKLCSVPNTISFQTKFVKNIKKYHNSKAETLDLLHVTICQENYIPTLVSYDRGLTNIKDLLIVSPQEYLNQ